MLSDSDSEDENDVQLTINEHLRQSVRAKEGTRGVVEMYVCLACFVSPNQSSVQYRTNTDRMQSLYGEDSDEDSEEDESEDEDGEELTPAVDAAILRTLAPY